MRLGAPIRATYRGPEEWVAAVRSKGYRVANAPVKLGADHAEIADYRQAAAEADIVIAEVGAWGNNPLSPDPTIRAESIRRSQDLLVFADEIGARCCVNVAGSRGPKWDGPHDDNLTPSTFDLVVETTREIIDGAMPREAKWALECMPYLYPHTTEAYAALLEAIDRPEFAVHLDPVNMMTSPERYYGNGELIRGFVERLGPLIVSCHAKDTILLDALTFHVDEARPGAGHLDYAAYLTALDTLDPDLPLMVEHLKAGAEYDLAVAHIRSVAEALGIAV